MHYAATIVWPVSIATVAGTAMVMRETTDHATPLAVERYSAGFRSPLLTTATGRTYLAHCAVTERDTLLDALAKSNKEDDKPARGPRPELLHLLADIKAQGYATTSPYPSPGRGKQPQRYPYRLSDQAGRRADGALRFGHQSAPGGGARALFTEAA